MARPIPLVAPLREVSEIGCLLESGGVRDRGEVSLNVVLSVYKLLDRKIYIN